MTPQGAPDVPWAAAASDVVLVAALAAALVTDLRWRRIPHWITLPAAALGLALALVRGGAGSAADAPGLVGALAGLACGFVPFAAMALLGWVGGGDALLMGAAGALLGYPQALGALVLVSLAGGLLGVVAIALRSGPGRRLCARLGLAGTQEPHFARTVPYGVAIAAGSGATLVLRHALG